MMQPCKRQVRRFRAVHRPGPVLPEQAQSEKFQGVRGTESPDSFDNTLKKTENYVSVFSGESTEFLIILAMREPMFLAGPDRANPFRATAKSNPGCSNSPSIPGAC